jgi:ferredoxin-NADP reductase
LMSPEHLRQLVSDISEREVYVCGPPAMSAFIEDRVRQSGVPAKYIHSERFAFSPGASATKRVTKRP